MEGIRQQQIGGGGSSLEIEAVDEAANENQERHVDEMPISDQQRQKRYFSYVNRSIIFVITLFAEHFTSAASASSFSITKICFNATASAFFILHAPRFMMMFMFGERNKVVAMMRWADVLVFLTWILTVLLSYLFLLSFHKDYAYVISVVPVPLAAAYIHKLLLLRGTGRQGRRTGNDIEAGRGQGRGTNDTQHDDDRNLDNIFEWSSGIVNAGGLITLIMGHYLLNEVNAVGFFFFFTLVLGLYLMLVTTVRTETLCRHATCLAVILYVLVAATIVTAVINGAPKREDAFP